MKKFLKSCLLILAIVCVSFSFVGCKKKVSETTTNVDNVKLSNGVTTNGGMTVVYGDYLYFINGSKDNDGTCLKDNKRGAICRVKFDMTTGKTTGDMEVVIDELAGFSNGSLNIFGDYLYYTAPCADENYKSEVLYNKTCFKRYDLVNKKSYLLYTTAQNSSDESIEFTYYVVGDTLNLLVYEEKNATITSLKINKKVTTNYTISDVTDCVFSDHYGKVTTSGATVDANSYVFYAKSPELYDYPQTGSKIYKTSPVTDNSTMISQGKDISLLTIRSGKLVYSYNKAVYAQKITAETNETLLTENTNCISRSELTNAIYLEDYELQGKDTTAKLVKSEGHITVLSFNSDTYYLSIFEWASSTNSMADNHTDIAFIDSAKDFEFMGITTIQEIVTKDDPDTEENEEVKRTVMYALYRNDDKAFKVEIAEIKDDEIKVTIHSQIIQLSGSTLTDTNGKLLPEAVGNYLFVISEDDDKHNYLIKIDLTTTKNVEDESSKFAIEE